MSINYCNPSNQLTSLRAEIDQYLKFFSFLTGAIAFSVHSKFYQSRSVAVLLATILCLVSSQADARKVCGIEIGNEKIIIVANLCLIDTVTPARIRRIYDYTHTCRHDGKRVIVGIRTKENVMGIYDFSSQKTKECLNPV